MSGVIPPQLSSLLFASGQKVLGLDAFGWGVVLFLLLFFGIGYTRGFFRRADIPNWPIVSARVEKTTIAPGPPRELLVILSIVPPKILVPYHCRANYVFLVDGTLYAGTFALLAKNVGQAQGLADSLRDRSILVKYNPRRPKDSIIEEPELLGTKVFQEGWSPINPKIW
jgi:hypothetical protein